MFSRQREYCYEEGCARGAPGENGFELSSTGSRTSTEIAVTDFLHVRREERLGGDWETELNQRAKEISLMRVLGLSTDCGFTFSRGCNG